MSIADRMFRKRLAYIRTFCGDGSKPHVNGETVLADLKRYCGVEKGPKLNPVTGMVDSYGSLYRMGQRDVYARIIKYLNLTEDEIGDYSDRAER